MTKRDAIKALSTRKTYIESLAIFAQWLETVNEEDREDALDALDDKIYFDLEGEKSDKWLDIYTALKTAC